MSPGTVSVITPCLNPGDRLRRCIRSVESQDHESIEHIVIDGGSNDGTLEYLSSKPRVKWISEPDSGQAAAINKGLRMATGEMIGWLNADDELLPGAISSLVEAMDRTGAGWAYGNIEIIQDHASTIWVPPDDPAKDLLKLGKGGVIPQPGSLVRDEAWKAVGDLDEHLELAMDFDLWLRLIDKKIPSVHVDRTVARFEIHSRSKTGASGLAAFYKEEARILSSRGHDRLASIAAGRAVAHESLVEGKVRQHLVSAGLSSLEVADPRLASAGAAAEAALLEGSLGHVAWRSLLKVDPWTVKETRRRLLRAMVGKIVGRA